MLCVLIVTSDRDTSFVVARLNELGYEVELYPAARHDEFAKLLKDTDKSSVPSFVHRNYSKDYKANAIRASFVKLLSDKRYCKLDDVIFCECDALPLVSAAELKEKLNELPADYDVCRLFNYVKFYSNGNFGPVAKELPVSWKSLNWVSSDIKSFNSNYHFKTVDINRSSFILFRNLIHAHGWTTQCNGWGMHALYVKKERRHALANLFSTHVKDVDCVLSYIAFKNIMNIYVPTVNLFLQLGHAARPTNKKFLLVLHTDADFLNIHRQLYNILDQRYKNFILVVYASELTQGEIDKWIVPAFKHYIDNGLLIIIPGYCKDTYNSVFSAYDILKQLEFDLFIQLRSYAADNADFFFYNPDFLENINELHRHMQSNVGSWSDTDPAIVLSKLELLYMSKYADNRKAMLEYTDLPDDSDISNEDLIRNFAITLLKRKGGVCRDNCYPILKPCLPETI